MDIKIIQQKELATMAIKSWASYDEMGKVMGECLSKLWTFIQSNNGQVCAEPYVKYLEKEVKHTNMEVVPCIVDTIWSMEIGFPVVVPLQGEGEIFASTIPSGKCALAILKGSYDNLRKHWNEFLVELETQGYQVKGVMREHYLNDPSMVKQDELITHTIIPVE